MTESGAATSETEAARRAVEAVWHIESARLVAGLARVTRDVGLAEDMAQDALVAALEQWPVSGIPPNPAGWLMTTAKRRAIDAHRRDETFARKAALLGADGPPGHGRGGAVDSDEALDAMDDHIGDDLLRLVFTSCHPALSLESRVALTLRCLAGLSTDEIARAFLVPEATAAQRIVRAKRTLTEQGITFELPSPEQLSERLSSVLEVVYLVFNEGYAATAGEQWVRPELCSEAMRLGRLLAGLVPDEPEVHGLLALMELQASRLPARVGPAGEAVLLPDQDRRRWDRLLVRRGLEALARAESLPGPIGPYTAAGRHRGLPCAGQPGRGHRLGSHRGRSTRCSLACGPRPSWSSIALWPWASRTDPRPGWPSSMPPRRPASSTATRTCTACAATCSRVPAEPPRPPPPSGSPRSSPATRASGPLPQPGGIPARCVEPQASVRSRSRWGCASAARRAGAT